jgi:hypothetical protein
LTLEFLKRFEPESEGLLRSISSHISDAMLRKIAEADYGEDVDEHLAALKGIRDPGVFREPFGWCPAEVLELIRWSEPDDPDWQPSGEGEFGHWMRAFSCVALLRATGEPLRYGDGLATDVTVIQMLLSLQSLSTELDGADVRFLAWLVIESERGRDHEQTCAYVVALLWRALHYPSKFPNELVLLLAEWTVEKFSEQGDRRSPPRSSKLRQLGMPRQKSAGWQKLALKFLELDPGAYSPELRTYVSRICEEIQG